MEAAAVLKTLNPKLYSNQLSAPALLLFAALFNSERFGSFARANLVAQLAVFIPVVQIPALLTGRLSYVDIAWPTGLLVMGLMAFGRAVQRALKPQGNSHAKSSDAESIESAKAGSVTRSFVVAAAYIFQGGRMALGAWQMFFAGHMRKEMQRYTFQRLRWGAVGIPKGSLAAIVEMQKEAFTQCLANLGPLCMPLALQTCVDAGPMKVPELASWCLWFLSFWFEHTSDLQKFAFGRSMKKQGIRGKVCDVGFWRYSRHPNYFGEWMVWVSLALASLPSLHRLLSVDAQQAKNESAWSKVAASIGLVMCPVSMYICLVHWTGAVPAEYFSSKNRAGYFAYSQAVNCFFPGLPLASPSAVLD